MDSNGNQKMEVSSPLFLRENVKPRSQKSPLPLDELTRAATSPQRPSCQSSKHPENMRKDFGSSEGCLEPLGGIPNGHEVTRVHLLVIPKRIGLGSPINLNWDNIQMIGNIRKKMILQIIFIKLTKIRILQNTQIR